MQSEVALLRVCVCSANQDSCSAACRALEAPETDRASACGYPKPSEIFSFVPSVDPG
jgi:hypothetical protein